MNAILQHVLQGKSSVCAFKKGGCNFQHHSIQEDIRTTGKIILREEIQANPVFNNGGKHK